MSFKFNKVGNFAIPSWSSGTGDYSISGAFKYAAGDDFQIILAGSGTSHITYQDTGGTVKFTNPTLTLSGFVIGNDYWYDESRTVNSVTVSIYNYNTTTKVIGTLVDTGVGSYGGTNKPRDSFGSSSTGSFDFDGEMAGTWTFTDDASAVRTYEFDQPVGTAGLPEPTLSQDGVKANGNNGDYTGSGTDSISITSHSDGDVLKRDSASGSKVVTLSGAIAGVQPTSVEVSVDFGAWVTIDAAPTTTTWAGTVTLTKKQSVRIRGIGAGTLTPSLTLTVAMVLAAIGDSNQYGYGINLQPVEIPAFSYQPLMYNGTTLVDVVDPTVTGADGSTLPRIVSRYASDGTPICIYNIGLGGTKASNWQKGGANYDKLAAFATLVGGIEAVTVQLGTNDAAAAVSQALFTADMNAIVNDIFTDFGAATLITKFASDTVGSQANRDDIFAAIDDVVNTNANAYAGGDLSVIDISIGAATGNDGIHLKQDVDLVTAGDIIYDATVAIISSTLTLSIADMPAGSFDTVLSANGIEIYRGSATYTTGSLSLALPTPIGTTVKGRVDDAADPSTDGAYLEGVTI